MAAPVEVRKGDEEGVDNRHPAQTPDSKESLSSSDELTANMSTQRIPEEDAEASGSLQKSGSSLEASGPHEQYIEPAYEEDVIQSAPLREASVPDEARFTFNSSHPALEESGSKVNAEDSHRDSIQSFRSPPAVDESNHLVNGPQSPASATLEHVSESHSRSTDQDTLDTSAAGLSWDPEVSAGSVGNLGLSTEEPLGLDRFARTNSFPDVPPLPKSSLPPHSLPHSQAEDIMEEDEEEETNSKDPGFDEAPSADGNPDGSIRDPFSDDMDEDQNHFLSSAAIIHGGDVKTPLDEEARFEEGLPLMQSSSNRDDAIQDRYCELNQSNSFRGRAPDADDDLFEKSLDSGSEETSFFRPQALDRETTSQVLGSMQYPPHSETHDDQPSIQRPALADVTGGGIEVSSSTVLSQVLAETQRDDGESGKKNDDLAAMWQAALDDDELLEDDAADPSSLFEDDESGFLDDDLGDTDAQLDSSPQLQPVYSPQGSMQGFTKTNTKTQPDSSTIPQGYTPYIPSQPHDHSSQGFASGQTPNGQAASGLSSSVSAPTGFSSKMMQQPFYTNASAQRPQMPSSAQSFANKSKGGYASPYDLPMDVTRPKKRNVTQQLRPGSQGSSVAERPSAPPRSSSMFPSSTPVSQSHPPLPPLPAQTTPARPPPMANITLKIKASAGSFFEELPSVKPRPSASTARSHAPFAPHSHPSQPPLPVQPHQASVNQRPSSSSSSSLSSYGLVPPGRMGPYSDALHQTPITPNVPNTNARYSPAPASVQNANVPPSRTRYAASPAGSTRAPPPASLPFQPRTSSPLAHNNIRPGGTQEAGYSIETSGTGGGLAQHEPTAQQLPADNFPPSNSQSTRSLGQSSDYNNSPRATSDPPALDHESRSSHFSPPPTINRYDPATNISTRSNAMIASETNRLASTGPPSAFDARPLDSTSPGFPPPRRSQTQSPGAMLSRPSAPSAALDLYQRPASVNDRALPPQVAGSTSTGPFAKRSTKVSSRDVEYMRPTDGRENDPLERWKGCPLFAFGFGGTVVTSFPKQVQRYAAGHKIPLTKCSPGEVRIQSRKVLLDDYIITSFPGPLKPKNKKKEVSEWMQQQMQRFEQSHIDITSSTALPDPRKRSEEKILLWRIMKVLVESDGVVEGKPAAEKAVRLILSPELVEDSTDELPPSSNSQLLGISRATGSSHIPDPTQPGDVENLRKILLQGEREKAVWHALDKRLWAHAMLISSTMDKQVWKQVLQEFIRQEVKSFGDNTESLASLYQIFAGNWEESVDELVPPSARAGLQFVSKAAGTGPAKNALDGLDRWRETLTLALSNRTHDDGKALVALGQLLSSYGRVEAAHICFIFARLPGIFGGVDDPQASFTLLGTNHSQLIVDMGRDIDSILLTEVYEYVSTILAPSTAVMASPHFQAYKIYHAMLLAEHGLRNEAQEYCTVVTSTMKSTTKLSPYYHSLLFTALDDLNKRLRQAPNTASASWMSKPSLDKVSGSFLSRVNQFIAGDESDADPAASGKGTDPAAGPFAGVTGDTPNISRSPSSNDLYNAYPSTAPLTSSMASTSRYAPGGQYAAQGQYTPRSSMEQNNGPVQDYRTSSHNDMLRPQPSNLSRPSSSGNMYQRAPLQSTKLSYQPAPQSAPLPLQRDGYPTPPSAPEYMSAAPPENLSHSLYQQEPYHPTPPPEQQPPENPYQASNGQELDRRQENNFSSYQPSLSENEPTQNSYQLSPSSYEPSAMLEPSSSYEPPSYNPYNPDTQADETSPVDEKPKKKSFMDDDEDDFGTRAAALLKEEKARKDREADEAFRKAAEADAQKGDLKSKKSGWLGGWFGGKKDGDLSSAQNGATNAPIRAKLGEESSFYYDNDLKKWVNKKAGGEAPAAAAATPPPPKGPPSRAVSASGGPPIRKDTETPPVPPLPASAFAQAAATPPISVSRPPTAAPAPMPSPYSSTPASRSESPAVMQGEQQTAQASSGTGAGLAIAGLSANGPPSRPATAMSNASSIDDLIGAPQARKGGTIKKGKKGRGYVDLMAK